MGWDLFGTAGRRVDFTILSPSTIAYIQAGAIVVGHVAGVLVAHDRALALFGQRDATRSPCSASATLPARSTRFSPPWCLFTVGGLFLLSEVDVVFGHGGTAGGLAEALVIRAVVVLAVLGWLAHRRTPRPSRARSGSVPG